MALKWWLYNTYWLKERTLYVQQNGNFFADGDIYEIFQKLCFIWANPSSTKESALLQLCCIITDN